MTDLTNLISQNPNTIAESMIATMSMFLSDKSVDSVIPYRGFDSIFYYLDPTVLEHLNLADDK